MSNFNDQFSGMKKHIVTTVLLFLCITASAQRTIFFGEEVGLGNSYQDIQYQAGNTALKPARTSPATALSLDIYVGFTIKHWSFQTGVGYLRSGYIRYFNYGGANMEEREVLYFPSVVFPFLAGYELKLSHRWSLVPHGGFIIGQNLGASINTTGGDYHLPSSTFNSAYHQQSLWAVADAEARYYFGRWRQRCVFIVPRIELMTTTITKDITRSMEHGNLRLNNFTLNIGVSRYIKLHPKPKVEEVEE